MSESESAGVGRIAFAWSEGYENRVPEYVCHDRAEEACMRATFGGAEAGFATVSVAAESVHGEVENETASVRAVESGSAA